MEIKKIINVFLNGVYLIKMKWYINEKASDHIAQHIHNIHHTCMYVVYYMYMIEKKNSLISTLYSRNTTTNISLLTK